MDTGPGFFGKIPTHADFVSRRVSRTFLDRWDGWLQQGMTQSRQTLGPRWPDVYLTSPLWRFALSAGVIDGSAWTGLFFPSEDRVKRHFPFTVCAPIDSNQPLVALLDSPWQQWFQEVEELALSCLEEDFDLEAFDQCLRDRNPPDSEADAVVGGSSAELCPMTENRPWRLGIASVDAAPLALPRLTEALLRGLVGSFTLWWTTGSDRVAPSLIICQRLPAPKGFVSLLDGGWSEQGWIDHGTTS